ncbi:glutathione S-transferase N-terminal domain-containing protein, partial [Providencia stuartii]|uniref:glutathione S-transferase N-terminal domain-containing protein n=1 Tax=Providencia stuartii TaxID=588 RepID=UPI00195482F3
KGISIPSVAVDLGKLEQKSEAYTAINPRQRTPALELDDGSVLCESMAICRYVEALHPDPNLFGRTPAEI